MTRVALYIGGISAAIAAWIAIQRKRNDHPPTLSAADAAAKLREAWADHHTVA